MPAAVRNIEVQSYAGRDCYHGTALLRENGLTRRVRVRIDLYEHNKVGVGLDRPGATEAALRINVQDVLRAVREFYERRIAGTSS